MDDKKLLEEKIKENPDFPFTYENGRRIARIEDITLFAKNKREYTEKMIEKYNQKPENSNRQAIKGGSRKERCKDEQRVLDSFVLK